MNTSLTARHGSTGAADHVHRLQNETAEKAPSVFEKWGFRKTVEPKLALISPQERGRLGKKSTFSALSKCDITVYFVRGKTKGASRLSYQRCTVLLSS
jgi:hypothetical protein